MYRNTYLWTLTAAKDGWLRTCATTRTKDRFWANVSHELRTPLNSIIGLTRLLAEPAPDGTALDAERLYQTELIRNSGSTLLALVNDLLDVAKAESGQLHVDPAQVDLPALFGRLRGLARPMAEGKPAEVIVSADGDPGTPATILTDEVALTSILRNLLSNGIKYTDRGEVRLSTRVTGRRLEISVADTGIGIPAGLHDHVFEEFYQVPGVRRGGTGLGLPYARRLARILGGNLTLASEPGAGTTVVLGLPLRTPAVGIEALRWQDRVLVAIGDVQGHSLHAATVMGELRHALRAFVLEGHSPLAITGLVNDVLIRYHPGIIATLCLAVLDPASGEVQIVNCGHMPPLLVGEQGAGYVGEGGLLLGLPMHEPNVATAFLPPGGTLLLMTDGLVEERGVFLDVNLEKLRVAAQEAAGADVEAFSNHLMSIFGPREDDVAMVAVRRT
jgi:anti-sigma regulatory factor (Ser/Thr protein kinase)